MGARDGRWAGSDMRGYGVVPLDEETEQTPAAEPPEPRQKKAKPQTIDD